MHNFKVQKDGIITPQKLDAGKDFFSSIIGSLCLQVFDFCIFQKSPYFIFRPKARISILLWNCLFISHSFCCSSTLIFNNYHVSLCQLFNTCFMKLSKLFKFCRWHPILLPKREAGHQKVLVLSQKAYTVTVKYSSKV